MTTLDSQPDKKLCDLDNQPHADLDNTILSSGFIFPDGWTPLESQMAGHPFDSDKHTIGMLRGPNGRVLKPATKAILGEREIAFYEELQTSREVTLMELKNFVPRYYGTTELQIFGKRTKFLTLKDITEGMAEPCVMDIKIGRRTWDPLATPEKRATEEHKYAESKRAYGFCITGFQVYCLSTGRLKKFDRHYGKKLDAKGVVEALETFLNMSPGGPVCRHFIGKLLSCLQRIATFFRAQRKFRLYSSSLLVAYDAKRLRHHYRQYHENFLYSINYRTKSESSTSSGTRTIPVDVCDESTSHSTTSSSNVGTKRSRTETKQSEQAQKRSASLVTGTESMHTGIVSDRSGPRSPNFKADGQCRTDCCTNNSNDDVKKNDNVSLSEEEQRSWIRVNMIDFTHVFPADDQSSLDENYLEGIKNLYRLVKSFLNREDSSK